MSEQKSISIKTAATETALYQDLVLDAERHAHISLPENLESYLVFLLLRYNRGSHGLYEPVALSYMHATNQTGHLRTDGLRNAGDNCLLLAGLFPGQAKRRMVETSYFIRMGRSCYHCLAGCLKKSHAELYNQLCHGFGSMLEILQTIHGFDRRQKGLTPIEAYELWQETGSRLAFNSIGKNHAIIPVRNRQNYII